MKYHLKFSKTLLIIFLSNAVSWISRKQERLTAGDMLQIRKVAKHVYEKIFLEDSEMEVDEEEAILVRLLT